VAQSHARRDAGTSVRRLEYGLDKHRRGLPRTRPSHLDVYRLLLGQPRHALADSGKGREIHIAFTDSTGTPLSGDSSYKINLPPNVPAANFWSVTLYDAANASGLANGQPFPSLGSRDKPAQNADGSTDLYLGPKAPEGKAGNWLATVPGKGYFAILRLYGPTEAAINKSWVPGDIVKVN
jgi:hypothetical protein